MVHRVVEVAELSLDVLALVWLQVRGAELGTVGIHGRRVRIVLRVRTQMFGKCCREPAFQTGRAESVPTGETAWS